MRNRKSSEHNILPQNRQAPNAQTKHKQKQTQTTATFIHTLLFGLNSAVRPSTHNTFSPFLYCFVLFCFVLFCLAPFPPPFRMKMTPPRGTRRTGFRTRSQRCISIVATSWLLLLLLAVLPQAFTTQRVHGWIRKRGGGRRGGTARKEQAQGQNVVGTDLRNKDGGTHRRSNKNKKDNQSHQSKTTSISRISFFMASCARYSECQDLDGDCCPNAQGEMLRCCFEPGTCEATPKCDAMGMKGQCCPAPNNTMLDCCFNDDGTLYVDSNNNNDTAITNDTSQDGGGSMYGSNYDSSSMSPTLAQSQSPLIPWWVNAFGNATCASHAKCQHLKDDCCPNKEGKVLACCLGPGTCELTPKCDAMGLTGQCCPAPNNTMLDCCFNDDGTLYVDNNNDTAITKDISQDGGGSMYGSNNDSSMSPASRSPLIPWWINAFGNATCASHAKCQHLKDDCCPNKEGKVLACCLGPGTCELTPKCDAMGLTGQCCPAPNNTMLDCCFNDDGTLYVDNNNDTAITEDISQDGGGSMYGSNNDSSMSPASRSPLIPWWINAFGNATCASHAKCQHLKDDCCPNKEGKILACCLGPGTCELTPKCDALGLKGQCCPAPNNTMLDCCFNDDGTLYQDITTTPYPNSTAPQDVPKDVVTSTSPSSSPFCGRGPPTISGPPQGLLDSLPSSSPSNAPSRRPSQYPSITLNPTISSSTAPSSTPSKPKSVSWLPSTSKSSHPSFDPTTMPSLSTEQSNEPTFNVEGDPQKSDSTYPSVAPSTRFSYRPSNTMLPSRTVSPSSANSNKVAPSSSLQPQPTIVEPSDAPSSNSTLWSMPAPSINCEDIGVPYQLGFLRPNGRVRFTLDGEILDNGGLYDRAGEEKFNVRLITIDALIRSFERVTFMTNIDRGTNFPRHEDTAPFDLYGSNQNDVACCITIEPGQYYIQFTIATKDGVRCESMVNFTIVDGPSVSPTPTDQQPPSTQPSEIPSALPTASSLPTIDPQGELPDTASLSADPSSSPSAQPPTSNMPSIGTYGGMKTSSPSSAPSSGPSITFTPTMQNMSAPSDTPSLSIVPTLVPSWIPQSSALPSANPASVLQDVITDMASTRPSSTSVPSASDSPSCEVLPPGKPESGPPQGLLDNLPSVHPSISPSNVPSATPSKSLNPTMHSTVVLSPAPTKSIPAPAVTCENVGVPYQLGFLRPNGRDRFTLDGEILDDGGLYERAGEEKFNVRLITIDAHMRSLERVTFMTNIDSGNNFPRDEKTAPFDLYGSNQNDVACCITIEPGEYYIQVSIATKDGVRCESMVNFTIVDGPSVSPTPTDQQSPSTQPSEIPSALPMESNLPTIDRQGDLPDTASPSADPSSSPSAQPPTSNMPSIGSYGGMQTSSPSSSPSSGPSKTFTPTTQNTSAPSDPPSLSIVPTLVPSWSPQPSALPSANPASVLQDVITEMASTRPSSTSVPSASDSPSFEVLPPGNPKSGPPQGLLDNLPSEHPSISPSNVPSATPSKSLNPTLRTTVVPSPTPKKSSPAPSGTCEDVGVPYQLGFLRPNGRDRFTLDGEILDDGGLYERAGEEKFNVRLITIDAHMRSLERVTFMTNIDSGNNFPRDEKTAPFDLYGSNQNDVACCITIEPGEYYIQVSIATKDGVRCESMVNFTIVDGPSVSPTPTDQQSPSTQPSEIPSALPTESNLPTIDRQRDLPDTASPSADPSSSPSAQPPTSNMPSIGSYGGMQTSSPSSSPSSGPSKTFTPTTQNTSAPSDPPSLSIVPTLVPSWSLKPSALPSANPASVLQDVITEMASTRPSSTSVPSASDSPSFEVLPPGNPKSGPPQGLLDNLPSEHPSISPSNVPSATPSKSLNPTLRTTVVPSPTPKKSSPAPSGTCEDVGVPYQLGFLRPNGRDRFTLDGEILDDGGLYERAGEEKFNVRLITIDAHMRSLERVTFMTNIDSGNNFPRDEATAPFDLYGSNQNDVACCITIEPGEYYIQVSIATKDGVRCESMVNFTIVDGPSVSPTPTDQQSPSTQPSEIPSALPTESNLPTIDRQRDLPDTASPSADPSSSPSAQPPTSNMPSIGSYGGMQTSSLSSSPSSGPSKTFTPTTQNTSAPSDPPSLSIVPTLVPSWSLRPSALPSANPASVLQDVITEMASTRPSSTSVPSASDSPSFEVLPPGNPKSGPPQGLLDNLPSEHPSISPSNVPSATPSKSLNPTLRTTVVPSPTPKKSSPAPSGTCEDVGVPYQLGFLRPNGRDRFTLDGEILDDGGLYERAGEEKFNVRLITIDAHMRSLERVTFMTNIDSGNNFPRDEKTAPFDLYGSNQNDVACCITIEPGEYYIQVSIATKDGVRCESMVNFTIVDGPSVSPTPTDQQSPSTQPSEIPSALPTESNLPTIDRQGDLPDTASPSADPSSSPSAQPPTSNMPSIGSYGGMQTSSPSSSPSSGPSKTFTPTTQNTSAPSDPPSLSIVPTLVPSWSLKPSALPSANPASVLQDVITEMASTRPSSTSVPSASDSPSFEVLPPGNPKSGPPQALLDNLPSEHPSISPSNVPSDTPSKSLNPTLRTTVVPSPTPKKSSPAPSGTCEDVGVLYQLGFLRPNGRDRFTLDGEILDDGGLYERAGEEKFNVRLITIDAHMRSLERVTFMTNIDSGNNFPRDEKTAPFDLYGSNQNDVACCITIEPGEYYIQVSIATKDGVRCESMVNFTIVDGPSVSPTPTDQQSPSTQPSEIPSALPTESDLPTIDRQRDLPDTASPSADPSSSPSAQPPTSNMPSIGSYGGMQTSSPSSSPSSGPSKTFTPTTQNTSAPSDSPSLSIVPTLVPSWSLKPSALPSANPASVLQDVITEMASTRPSSTSVPSASDSPSCEVLPPGNPKSGPPQGLLDNLPSEHPSISPSNVPSDTPSKSLNPTLRTTVVPSPTPKKSSPAPSGTCEDVGVLYQLGFLRPNGRDRFTLDGEILDDGGLYERAGEEKFNVRLITIDAHMRSLERVTFMTNIDSGNNFPRDEKTAPFDLYGSNQNDVACCITIEPGEYYIQVSIATKDGARCESMVNFTIVDGPSVSPTPTDQQSPSTQPSEIPSALPTESNLPTIDRQRDLPDTASPSADPSSSPSAQPPTSNMPSIGSYGGMQTGSPSSSPSSGPSKTFTPTTQNTSAPSDPPSLSIVPTLVPSWSPQPSALPSANPASVLQDVITEMASTRPSSTSVPSASDSPSCEVLPPGNPKSGPPQGLLDNLPSVHPSISPSNVPSATPSKSLNPTLRTTVVPSPTPKKSSPAPSGTCEDVGVPYQLGFLRPNGRDRFTLDGEILDDGGLYERAGEEKFNVRLITIDAHMRSLERVTFMTNIDSGNNFPRDEATAPFDLYGSNQNDVACCITIEPGEYYIQVSIATKDGVRCESMVNFTIVDGPSVSPTPTVQQSPSRQPSEIPSALPTE